MFRKVVLLSHVVFSFCTPFTSTTPEEEEREEREHPSEGEGICVPHSEELWGEGIETCVPWLSLLAKVWKEERAVRLREDGLLSCFLLETWVLHIWQAGMAIWLGTLDPLKNRRHF